MFLDCFVLALLYYFSLPPLLSFNPEFMMMLTVLTGRSDAVFAVKLYPAGATTNSQGGVTDLFGKCLPVLEEMAEQNMPLLVTSPY